MSSTNRGAIRSEHDYYVTNPADVETFLRAWMDADDRAQNMLSNPKVQILDPCAGGNVEPVSWLFKEAKGGKPAVIFDIDATPCSYPKALRAVLGEVAITTLDIRPDSAAEYHRDYLNDPLPMDDQPHLIISNPPFSLALDFIRHSLVMVRPYGFVVMLLRVNFFGSAKRKPFFGACLPDSAYVHHERLSFTPDGKTDSIEYAHMVWHKGSNPQSCALRVI